MIIGFSLSAAAHNITLIHMGDLHGHLVPRPQMGDDVATTDYQVGGLAYVYHVIKGIRAKQKHTLLLNTGDTIQGSVEALFSRGQHIIDVLNTFNIDAFTPGNWDFLYGTERFIELFAGKQPKANWTTLAANLYYTTLYEFPLSPYPARAGQRVVAPYVIKHVGQLTVALIGLTANRGPSALSSRLMDGFYLSPGEEELRQVVTRLRNTEQVDLLVLLSTRGLAVNLAYAERIPGIDVVLSSGMHEQTHHVLVTNSGTLLVAEGQDGTMVGELALHVNHRQIQDWQWTPHLINTQTHQPDPQVNAMIEQIRDPFVKGPNFVPHVNPINAAVLRTPIDTVIGHTDIALHRVNFSDADTMPAVIEGTAHNLLADAFRNACNADVGIMHGFRYGTHIAPGPIRLEDIYHYISIGPQIACGEISGDDLYLAIERAADSVLSLWVENWSGGWLTAFSGMTYDLDPGNEYRVRVSNLRINGERADPARLYQVAGYWYLDLSNEINGLPAQNIRVLRDAYGGIVDAADVVAYYLRSLPSKTVKPIVSRVHLRSPLPRAIGINREIQPLRGFPRPDF